jgi:3-(3-hydroxy-phenyl)propionate hydroxylase
VPASAAVSKTYDVLIVGFGPAGAVAACLLGAYGISTLIVDKAVGIYDKPRAVSLDHEIARIFQNIGIGEALKAHVEPFTASEYFGVDGQLIKRLDMLPPPFPMGWTPSMVFMQPALEELLRKRAGELGSVDIRLGVDMVGLEQDSDIVTAHMRGPDGVLFTVRSKYLIGCDGASSTVRLLTGIPLDDLGFDQPWLVVDVLANERGLAKLPTVSAQYCEPARPTTYIVCTGNHRRWELMLLPSEDPRRMESSEEVWRLLRRWIDPADAELWRSASYRFHALVAADWRLGRIFLAGDAAHQQPPFLGQGMCQGVRDVTNLAWKLARVVQGNSDGALLDTYGIERGGHVRQLHAVIKGIGSIVAERNESAARIRDARLLAEAGGVVRSVPRQQLQPSLTVGCLASRSHGVRGTLFPQPRISTNFGPRLLDEVVGTGLRLVLDRQFPPVTADQIRQLARLDARAIRLTDAPRPLGDHAESYSEFDGVARKWFKANGCGAAVVRPDHYIFGAASDIPALTETLEQLASALLRPF